MSRFKVGEEITARNSCMGLTRGKFYRVNSIDGNLAVISNDEGWKHCISNEFGLTRAEYEQAEREKDPFAPGKWVVCVGFGPWWMPGEIVQSSGTLSLRPEYFGSGDRAYRKSHFRPATPEEIKEQKQKVMNETKDDSAATERQTFAVGGKEFYVGQKVWVTNEELFFTSGTQLEVIGPVNNAPLALCVRKPSSSMTYFIGHAAITTTPPKPHEWKFGDWARHPEYGVCFVMSGEDEEGEVMLGIPDNWTYKRATELTYISTTEIPE